MIQDKTNRKVYFENEDYLDPELGYPERDIQWFKSNILNSFLNNFTSTSGLILLDVGCAFGYYTRILSDKFHKTYGVDFSESRITYAKKYDTNKLKFILADLTSDTFSDVLDVKFNCVFTNAVIPHIPLHLKQKVFSNIAKVCEKDAIFVLYDALVSDGCLDDFVGLFSINWIKENCPEWEYLSHRLITSDGTFEIVLKKKI